MQRYIYHCPNCFSTDLQYGGGGKWANCLDCNWTGDPLDVLENEDF